MEPYRALIGDKLPQKQLSLGYQMQSLFVGAGTVIAMLSIIYFQEILGVAEEVVGSIPQWLYYSFFIGAILSITTILWSVSKTKEIPPSDGEMVEIEEFRGLTFAQKFKHPFIEIAQTVKTMPPFMWKVAGVYLFQWYALFVYWQFNVPMFRDTLNFTIGEAASQSAKMSLTYNSVTMIVALVLVPLTLKYGGKKIYAVSLLGTAVAMFLIPYINDANLVLVPMILFGIGWAAMMGIPYTMVSKIVPQTKRGIYMGILNMMIVIPMAIETVTFGPIYTYLLGGKAINAILFAGVFFLISAILALRLTPKQAQEVYNQAE